MADSLLDGDPIITETAERDAIIAKWKDKPREELEAAKAESDLYIKTLTARLDDLKKDYLDIREQHQASTQLKELIDRLEKAPKPGQEDSRDTQREEVPPALKPEDIETLVSHKFSEHQRALKQQENFVSVQAKLREQLGENYQEVYKQRLDNLGLTKEFADDLAKNYPTAFMNTFGLNQTKSNFDVNLPRSSVRPSSFAPKTQKRDWAYYQELKKTNPRLYLDPKIAIQMHDDAIALGDEFGLPSN